ncbi:TPA: purine permease [Burkholderia vietnamiensis]|uniref:nucleobase:cation symporter-2 family protein n=1 Tax=Burkholderia vietnamiensis TaxID=60552 RepID=UPI001592F186|nr:nucleobase:cation symporter-2 family protein [Burkholderia vietnamiensis]MCA8206612.1 purine permease [Burkholderia vietnamiensis]HDR9101414.1 purine permease [Burkholderia vietnamiensis]HDR9121201.1 purine permease [Burkholderia vietnamiensis]HDR9168036.1 purine permease [Burkholderia vietnamiensis]
MQSNTVHPCDEVLPTGKLVTLGLQHVLVMYAGAVAVPLIVGGALKLPKDQIAFLISADLFSCGIATLIQTLGLWIFGIRLPVIMGCTFAAVGPMIAIGTNPGLGMLDIFGSTIAAGIIGIVLAPTISKLLRFFPPVVVGTVIAVIGLSLMEVGINWAAGGVGNPDYGSPVYLGLSLLVLTLILLINKYGRGFIANISVLLGIVAGFAIAFAIGRVNTDGVAHAPWVGFVMPFHFGIPHFDPLSIATMVTVMFVTFIESTGMFLAVGDMVDRPVDQERLVRGLRVDGLGTLIGGIFNSFPHTSFSQNVGLIGVTGVKSRYVCATGGVILVLLGLFPKMAQVVASVPPFVLGGAGIVMFGMVAANGIKVLSKVDFVNNTHNLFIVAVSVGMGLVPVVSPHFFSKLPPALAPILHSGILLASASAVLLNIVFNGVKGEKDARCEIRRAGHDFDGRPADVHH